MRFAGYGFDPFLFKLLAQSNPSHSSFQAGIRQPWGLFARIPLVSYSNRHQLRQREGSYDPVMNEGCKNEKILIGVVVIAVAVVGYFMTQSKTEQTSEVVEKVTEAEAAVETAVEEAVEAVTEEVKSVEENVVEAAISAVETTVTEIQEGKDAAAALTDVANSVVSDVAESAGDAATTAVEAATDAAATATEAATDAAAEAFEATSEAVTDTAAAAT